MRIITLVLCAVALCAAQPAETVDPQYAELAGRLFAAPDDAAREPLLSTQKDIPALVKTMNEMAGKVYDARKPDEAMKMYGVVCGIAGKTGNSTALGTCTLGIGLCLSRLLRLDEALQRYDEATRLYQSAGEHGKAAASLNAAGVLQHRRGQLKPSLIYLQRALEEAAVSRDEVAIAQTNTNLGNVYRGLARFAEAVQAMEKALAITEKLHLDRQSGWILNNLGTVAFEQHDLEVALNYHQKSLEIKEKGGDAGDIASTLVNIGTIYQSMEEYDKALERFQRGLNLAESGGRPDTRALALYNWGETLRLQGKLEEAKERLRAALDATKKLSDRSLAANCRITLAEIAVDQHRPAEGLAVVAPLVDAARADGDLSTLVRGLDVIGVANLSAGRLAEAEAALDEGIRAIEQMRNSLPGDQQSASGFFFRNVSLQQHMVEVQLARKRPLAALAFAEKSRGRTLMDVLQSGKTDVNKAMTAEEREKEAALSRIVSQKSDQILAESRRPAPDPKRVAELTRQGDQARADYRLFETSLYGRHAELRVQRVAFEPIAPAELTSSVPDAGDVAFLEYSVTDAATQLFVVTAGGRVEHFRLALDQHRLERDVKRFRGQIATRDLGYRVLAASLFRDLVEPARRALAGKKTLVIVPDGILWQLPFQALITGADRHLLEEHAIFYAPSLSVLYEMRKLQLARKPSAGRLLALEAAGSPSTRREVEGLRGVYGAAKIKVLAGNDADEESLRREAPKYQVLHLAAHGVFRDAYPMSSYLLIARAGKSEAGMLEAREMMDLDLHAGIVVLSGCETGRGDSGGGEGLLGMSWALFIAGSPSTVASQWKVESNSTSELMLAFHRSLQKESKASALQHAALEVMQTPEYRHPFYWSGFVLMGDGF